MKTIAISITFLTTLSSCSSGIFTSVGLGTGIGNRNWQPPVFVDAPLYPGGTSSAALVQSYDAAASNGTDGSLQAIASFEDLSSGLFKGYARKYIDGIGWSSAGSGFGIIASDTINNIGLGGIAAGPGGIFFSTFFFTASANVQTAGYLGSAWQTSSSSATSTYPPFTLNDPTLITTPRVVSAFDSAGRGYTFFIDGSGNVEMGNWQNASSSLSTLTTIDTGSSPSAAITAHFDGAENVCLTYEKSGALNAACANITLAPIALGDPITLSTLTVAGHESATDNAGNIMLVFYAQNGGNYNVYAIPSNSGTWASSATQIDTGVSMQAIPAVVTGARPGVAALGNNNFIAVWSAVNTTALTTQLYYSVYSEGTWSVAAAIPGTSDTYFSRAHPTALHVFGNGNLNAGFALNRIYSEGSSSATDEHVTWVARYQSNSGWLAVEQVGNGCTPGTSTMIGGCIQRPTGVILPSGTSVVLYQDQDASGNFRLAGVEFK